MWNYVDNSGTNLSRWKRAPKKQRLTLWRADAVQSITADKIHHLGIRISRIYAWVSPRVNYKYFCEQNTHGSGCILPTARVD